MHLLTLLIQVFMVALIVVDFELAAVLLVHLLLAVGHLEKYLLPNLALNLVFVAAYLTADALNYHGSWSSVNIDDPNFVLILQERLGCFAFQYFLAHYLFVVVSVFGNLVDLLLKLR